ncbi:uncharacterized protein TNCV_4056491 [Trichonephila clavipes]|nr:uncharacterized protein TNCV_4056491 [Trichonephila clavipes]
MYTAGHRKCNTKKDKRYHNSIYFVDNMLTKHQMIKFIDFCESWFLRESVPRVAAIVEDHRCHTPRKGLKKMDVFLGYNRPSSFHTLPKLIWRGCWRCNMDQSLSNYAPHVFYRRTIRRTSWLGKQFNLVIDQ